MNTSGATEASAKPKTNKDRIAALEGRMDANEKYLAATAERLEEFGAAVVADFDATKQALEATGAIMDERLQEVSAKFGVADSNFAEVAARIQHTNETMVDVLKDLGKKLDEDFARVYESINGVGQRLTDDLNDVVEQVNVVIDTVNDHSVALNDDDADIEDGGSGARAPVNLAYVLQGITDVVKDLYMVVDILADGETPDAGVMPDYDSAFDYVRNMRGEATVEEIYADPADEIAEAPAAPALYEDKGVMFMTLPKLPDGTDLTEAHAFDASLLEIVDIADADGFLTAEHSALTRRFLAGDLSVMEATVPAPDENLVEVMDQYADVETSAVVAFKAGENASANILQIVVTATGMMAVNVIVKHTK
jgi:uncharacterized protein YukE